jgi:hypothetical protein
MIYQPMHELLAYVREHDFETYIVSGGGIEFMRPWTEKVYGVPPEQVIGSTIKTNFEQRDGKFVLFRLPEVDYIDDKAGKPVSINKFIGRRPIAAFGNSDGDLQMLQWTTAGEGPRFGLIVHHTDAEREWAYDRQSSIGHLDEALDEAAARLDGRQHEDGLEDASSPSGAGEGWRALGRSAVRPLFSGARVGGARPGAKRQDGGSPSGYQADPMGLPGLRRGH